MKLTVKEIAKLVGGKINGSDNVSISGAAGLLEAGEGDISFVKDSKSATTLDSLKKTKASAVLVPLGLSSNGKTMIEVASPMEAFAKVLKLIADDKRPILAGVHPLASVAPTAKIGAGAFIGPFTVVEDHAVIGEGVQILAQGYVGRGSKIGKGTLLYPQVVLREEVSVGERCIIHSGAVIGADGYGFYFANGRHNKIEQIGTVRIEDDVEIGAGTTIDRATTGVTVIGKGTKIDNLVQVAHNVSVGPHSLLVAQVGIGGSTTLGAGVVLAGQVGVADHLRIGDGAQIGAQSGVSQDVEPNAALFGTPAQPVQDTLRQALLIRKLPEIFKDVKKLKERKS